MENETFDFFVNAKLPDRDGWKRDFSDAHFVERYLRGYLILSQMNQKEMSRIALAIEKHQKKSATQINKLATEIKKLNDNLTILMRTQEQMSYDFEGLKTQNEQAIKMLYKHTQKEDKEDV